MDATLEELSVQQETEDQNYDMCVHPAAALAPSLPMGSAGGPASLWMPGAQASPASSAEHLPPGQTGQPEWIVLL